MNRSCDSVQGLAAAPLTPLPLCQYLLAGLAQKLLSRMVGL